MTNIKDTLETLLENNNNNNNNLKKHIELLQQIDNFIIDAEIDLKEKEYIIKLLFELIIRNSNVDNIIDFLPNNIKELYLSNKELNEIKILFEQIYNSDICSPIEYTNIVNKYLEFLDKITNELFIHICYSKIEEFNALLLNYLDKIDISGLTNRNVINNIELELLLKEKINNINFLKQ